MRASFLSTSSDYIIGCSFTYSTLTLPHGIGHSRRVLAGLREAFQDVADQAFDLDPACEWPQPAPPLPRTNRVGRSDRAPRDLASVVFAHSAALVEALGLTFRRKARAEADSHVGALWNADERRSVLSVRRTPSRRRGRWQQ